MSDQPLRRRLLLVDDDPFVHRQVRHIAGRDFDVHCTLSTVTVTPDMLASLDTLVLDLNLPDGDAIGFMQGLGESARDIRLILVSGLEAKTIRLTATVARQLQFRSVEIAAKPLSAVKLAPLLQCSVPAQTASPSHPVRPCCRAARRWRRSCTGHWRAMNFSPTSSRNSISTADAARVRKHCAAGRIRGSA